MIDQLRFLEKKKNRLLKGGENGASEAGLVNWNNIWENGRDSSSTFYPHS